jgi:hypothetical protein
MIMSRESINLKKKSKMEMKYQAKLSVKMTIAAKKMELVIWNTSTKWAWPLLLKRPQLQRARSNREGNSQIQMMKFLLLNTRGMALKSVPLSVRVSKSATQ